MVSGSRRDTASDWRLFVIEYARSHNQPVASLLMGAYDEGVMDLPFAFVLAQRGDLNVLIDTGFMNKGGGAEMARRFSIPHWISPVRMLDELGVGAESVSHIVLSHAHYDHIGSIDQFPKAHIYMQKEELMTWIEALALPPRFEVLTSLVRS